MLAVPRETQEVDLPWGQSCARLSSLLLTAGLCGGGGVRALVDESSSSCRGERALLRDSLQRSEGTGNQTNLISSSHSWGFVQDEGGECTSLGKNSSIP